ncbi:MAG: helix-turn-helix domain-containing protein [Ruminococcus sp.]|nr:helix-turn-helix domain-containing protein [Ruminococcus sp.]
MDNYNNYDDLPVTLSADDMSKFLGISKCSCYALFKRKDFPTIKIGSRLLVSRDRFIEWLEKQTRRTES